MESELGTQGRVLKAGESLVGGRGCSPFPGGAGGSPWAVVLGAQRPAAPPHRLPPVSGRRGCRMPGSARTVAPPSWGSTHSPGHRGSGTTCLASGQGGQGRSAPCPARGPNDPAQIVDLPASWFPFLKVSGPLWDGKTKHHLAQGRLPTKVSRSYIPITGELATKFHDMHPLKSQGGGT